jgi:hypothetical protein
MEDDGRGFWKILTYNEIPPPQYPSFPFIPLIPKQALIGMNHHRYWDQAEER